jgi:hypothetical protein
MNDRELDPLLDQRLQALLDDRLGDKRDAGLRSATLDPATRRALGAYKAVYRALRVEPPSTLPAGFATQVAAAAGYAPVAGRDGPGELPAWLFAMLAGAGALALCAISIAAIGAKPTALLGAFGGPMGPLTVALIAAVVLDQVLAQRRAPRR